MPKPGQQLFINPIITEPPRPAELKDSRHNLQQRKTSGISLLLRLVPQCRLR
jgi:hypothetical protein